MIDPEQRVRFPVDGLGQFSAPAPWTATSPSWALSRGRTSILVVDDQLQALADLSDETALVERICTPFNCDFVFCPECSPGHPLARGGAWFAAVADRIEKQRSRLAAVLLDVMFDGEWNPIEGSGIRFLSRIGEIVPDLPVLIMTQARDERSLREALARSGLHLAFLQKDDPDRVGALCRFLYEFGWFADPVFGACSAVMRREASRLRRYSVVRPPLAGGLPQPILFVAGSGEGKTRGATLGAKALLAVDPPLRRRSVVEILDCNTLERGQGAQIALFGRGPRDARERADASGLAVRGKAQRAADGVLIVDELGNSSPAFQELLLTFIETGRTQPEWIHDGMTGDAVGPLNVLFEFTAQPRHIEEGRISADLGRRYARGTTVIIPPLAERVEDAMWVLFEASTEWQRRRPERDGGLSAEELILPEVESWLGQAVAAHGLSASMVVDLLGHPESTPLGVPYFEHHLKLVLAAQPGRSGNQGGAVDPEQLVPSRIPRSKAAGPSGTQMPAFPRDAAVLRGGLDRVTAEAAHLVLRYLEACAELASAGRSRPNVAGTYNLMIGNTNGGSAGSSPAEPTDKARTRNRADTTEARTRLKDLFLLNPQRTLEELRRSQVLVGLAIHVARGSRSTELRKLLTSLSREPGQLARLRELGWARQG